MTRLIRRLRADEGVTLVEMAVVMLVLSAILAFTMQSVASFQRASTGGVRRIENLNEARILMQVITKDVRTAAKLNAATSPFPDGPTGFYPVDNVTRAGNREVLFLANLNLTTPCPKLIRLYLQYVSSVDGYKLIESVTEPSGGTPQAQDCTWVGGATRTRLVGRYISNTTAQPIFTYYYADETGNLVPFTLADGAWLSTTDALAVKEVGVSLIVRKDTSLSVGDTTLENRVRLPNVFYNPPPSPSP
jgi:hypothetical protein